MNNLEIRFAKKKKKIGLKKQLTCKFIFQKIGENFWIPFGWKIVLIIYFFDWFLFLFFLLL